MNELICIIAGYKKQIKTCFFDKNPGLERRFPWWFDIKTYNPEELTEIFLRQVRKSNWDINVSREFI
jgi:hypothetical protein